MQHEWQTFSTHALLMFFIRTIVQILEQLPYNLLSSHHIFYLLGRGHFIVSMWKSKAIIRVELPWSYVGIRDWTLFFLFKGKLLNLFTHALCLLILFLFCYSLKIHWNFKSLLKVTFLRIRSSERPELASGKLSVLLRDNIISRYVD